MARLREYPDDDEYDPDDDSDPGFDGYADDGDATQPCPYCRAEIYEDAISCPKCGKYLSKEDRDERTQPSWVNWTALVLAILMGLGLLASL